MLLSQAIESQSQVLICLSEFLLKSFDNRKRCLNFLTLLLSLYFKLQLLDSLPKHLILLLKRVELYHKTKGLATVKHRKKGRLTLNLSLLDSYLFLLPLHNLTHVLHVIGPSNEPDFVETATCYLKIHLVIPVSFGQVLDLLEEDVRDDLDIVGFGMLTH